MHGDGVGGPLSPRLAVSWGAALRESAPAGGAAPANCAFECLLCRRMCIRGGPLSASGAVRGAGAGTRPRAPWSPVAARCAWTVRSPALRALTALPPPLIFAASTDFGPSCPFGPGRRGGAASGARVDHCRSPGRIRRRRHLLGDRDRHVAGRRRRPGRLRPRSRARPAPAHPPPPPPPGADPHDDPRPPPLRPPRAVDPVGRPPHPRAEDAVRADRRDAPDELAEVPAVRPRLGDRDRAGDRARRLLLLDLAGPARGRGARRRADRDPRLPAAARRARRRPGT